MNSFNSCNNFQISNSHSLEISNSSQGVPTTFHSTHSFGTELIPNMEADCKDNPSTHMGSSSEVDITKLFAALFHHRLQLRTIAFRKHFYKPIWKSPSPDPVSFMMPNTSVSFTSPKSTTSSYGLSAMTTSVMPVSNSSSSGVTDVQTHMMMMLTESFSKLSNILAEIWFGLQEILSLVYGYLGTTIYLPIFHLQQSCSDEYVYGIKWKTLFKITSLTWRSSITRNCVM